MDGFLVLLEIGLHRVTGGTELHLVGIGKEGTDTTKCEDTGKENGANKADFFPRQLLEHDVTVLPDLLLCFASALTMALKSMLSLVHFLACTEDGKAQNMPSL